MLCEASKALRTLIVTIEVWDEVTRDAYVSAASDASEGRVVLVPARAFVINEQRDTALVVEELLTG